MEALLAAAKRTSNGGYSKDGTFTLHEALVRHLGITALSKPVISRYNEFAQSKELDEILNDKERLNSRIEGREVVDLLSDYVEFGRSRSIGILHKLPSVLFRQQPEGS